MQSEDSSWRKDFLQGNFFGRKRSGSAENIAQVTQPIGNTSSVPTVNENQSIGTWKLIKGRVSQAMEDIKSSKTEGGNIKAELDGDDSDGDSATINSSISDDFNEAASFTVPVVSQPTLPRTINTDSDSDIEIDSDIHPPSIPETDRVILKKSPGNVPVRKRSTTDAILSKLNKKKEDCRLNSKSLLRHRKKNTPSPVRPPRKKDIEIESGIEITEEMSLSTVENETNDEGEAKNLTESSSNLQKVSTSESPNENSPIDKRLTPNNPGVVNAPHRSIFLFAFHNRGVLFIALTAVSCWALNVPPFIQGVLACLCSMWIAKTFFEIIGSLLNRTLSKALSDAGSCTPERGLFAIPNYDTMPVCSIPPVEDKKLKSYSGWMNEINNYDPTNYHISMTRSVFVKLDGSKLSISSTNARIPKRSMWNEQPIDRKSITFTKRCCYDLLGAHLEMCPKGLARKR